MVKGRKPAIPPTKAPQARVARPAPAWLDDQAKEAWELIAPILGNYEESDDFALAMICDAWSMYRKARAEIEEWGLTYSSITEAGGEIRRKHPAVEIASDAWQRFWKGASEFGLTPLSRVRLGIAGEGEEDEFLSFMQRGKQPEQQANAA